MIFDSYKRVINSKCSRTQEHLSYLEKTLLNALPANIKTQKFKRLEEEGYNIISLIEKAEEAPRNNKVVQASNVKQGAVFTAPQMKRFKTPSKEEQSSNQKNRLKQFASKNAEHIWKY